MNRLSQLSDNLADAVQVPVPGAGTISSNQLRTAEHGRGDVGSRPGTTGSQTGVPQGDRRDSRRRSPGEANGKRATTSLPQRFFQMAAKLEPHSGE